MNDTTLRDWQQSIISLINKHEDFVNTEEMLNMSDFDRNRESRIHVSLPRGQGHTFLAAYMACLYPTLFIYKDMPHWKEICKNGKIKEDNLNPKTSLISAYEISHDIFASYDKSNHLQELKKKFDDKKVILIDNATEITESFPRVIEWIMTITNPDSAIVLLG
jgi:hypothetical protein